MLTDTRHGRQARMFLIQWHLTHACDMHCAHCYDRSKQATLPLDTCKAIVDEMLEFCARREVKPGITLSGGNPFFYRSFFDLYRYIAERDVPISILGNPVKREQVEQMVDIAMPRYFQVSLEGMEEHTDCVRGPGAWERVQEFLPILQDLGVTGYVMVTLTKDNMDQIIPLGDLIKDKVHRMTFNRLSATGNGADLELPTREEYGKFMVDYLAANKRNKAFGFKDNLFNIFRHELGLPLLGGCTGHGCGAAFNFFAVLPNADAHACRKFPSRIGNLVESGFDAIYDSEEAERYRRGCSACDGCVIRSRCGGCLAVTAGYGLDPFTERDPHCFI